MVAVAAAILRVNRAVAAAGGAAAVAASPVAKKRRDAPGAAYNKGSLLNEPLFSNQRVFEVWVLSDV